MKTRTRGKILCKKTVFEGAMWVTMVVGFDRDGLLIPKWRDAFLQPGAHLA
ncbi:hypothetical protein ACO0K7_19230 [Undibacterium sp. Ji67W]|uniref:hypothetical protein n=1 Tax=Undibacterium sp. Ji67W TaxID=3413042 RepID=UPI003BF38141